MLVGFFLTVCVYFISFNKNLFYSFTLGKCFLCFTFENCGCISLIQLAELIHMLVESFNPLCAQAQLQVEQILYLERNLTQKVLTVRHEVQGES